MIQNQKRESFVFDWDRNRLTNPLKPVNFADICSYSSAFERAINLQATSLSASRKIYASSVVKSSLSQPLLSRVFPKIRHSRQDSTSHPANHWPFLGIINSCCECYFQDRLMGPPSSTPRCRMHNRGIISASFSGSHVQRLPL